MASAKVVIYVSKTLKNNEHPLMLQVIKDRKKKYFSIGHNCKKEHWDFEKYGPNVKCPNRKRLKLKIQEEEQKANRIILDFEDDEIDYSLEDFTHKYKTQKKNITVYKYFDEWISKFKKMEKVGNARVYNDTKNAIGKFTNEKDILFIDINLKFLNGFEEFYLKRGVKSNTISVYLRTLRSLYNKAIDDNIIKKELYPFTKYKISKLNQPTIKRSISKDDIKRIANHSLEMETSLWHSRNYFLFSFYNRGMNFMDLSLLRWDNINNNRIEYIRAKTGKHYSIALLPPTIEILDFYKTYNLNNEFIFPILNIGKHKTIQSRINRIQRCRKVMNRDLKTMANKIGIEGNLTSYVARHSWATILKRSGVSTSIISEGLGHETEKTTQIYLDSFEQETLDEANKMLL